MADNFLDTFLYTVYRSVSSRIKHPFLKSRRVHLSPGLFYFYDRKIAITQAF
jgi:hypothetical protein